MDSANATRDADHAEAMIMHLPMGARVSGWIQPRGMDAQTFTGTITLLAIDHRQQPAELDSVSIDTDQPLTTPAGRQVTKVLLSTPQEIARLRREPDPAPAARRPLGIRDPQVSGSWAGAGNAGRARLLALAHDQALAETASRG
jgi:hypothetical protein